MTQLYRSSGLPWTSKGFQIEPKLFIKIKPLAIQSQKGHKINTRQAIRQFKLSNIHLLTILRYLFADQNKDTPVQIDHETRYSVRTTRDDSSKLKDVGTGQTFLNLINPLEMLNSILGCCC